MRGEKQPCMMGRGMGNCLGLEGPQYTLDAKRIYAIEEGQREFAAEQRARSSQRRSREKESRMKLHEILASQEASGAVLVDQRIFYLDWYHEDWELRAHRVGGLPPGVDIARSKFGLLLLVPVIEEDTAKKLGYLKDAKACGAPKDSTGRLFFVSAELKDCLSLLFGRVHWERPLTIPEAKQFGVKVL
jgi:hypothetical protein